ncbi:MAG TPA: STAS/SEC14 domain-containing protein [Candidatus Salinicoccus stercoripullorum]|uniref:STAS/SEC14 domain-containing protein n=1 Tax=Candidatus Salinicoccus stercoripullorum TaxID=2838756 RepID=A0A9D1QI49_9STAP|nr:STAS/SEC14 domain-containing protein [Candidatus Salinicoccus stercoripullorum]
MIELQESGYRNILQMTVDGKMTEEDVDRTEAFIDEHYGDEETLNVLVDIKNLAGTDLLGIVKGMLMDIKHWKQYGKFAVVTDSVWVEGGSEVSDLAPGIEVEQYDRAQKDQAWEWLKK